MQKSEQHLDSPDPELSFLPATSQHWEKIVDLFGMDQGANGGCWCTWWRMRRSDWQSLGKEGRREHFRSLLDERFAPGIIALRGQAPAGWCAVAPRSAYPVITRSPVARPASASDIAGCWFVSCFYILPGFRRQGLTRALIEAAIGYAASNGARTVEAAPTSSSSATSDRFMGMESAFLACGFTVVEKRSAYRTLMRFQIESDIVTAASPGTTG